MLAIASSTGASGTQIRVLVQLIQPSAGSSTTYRNFYFPIESRGRGLFHTLLCVVCFVEAQIAAGALWPECQFFSLREAKAFDK